MGCPVRTVLSVGRPDPFSSLDLTTLLALKMQQASICSCEVRTGILTKVKIWSAEGSFFKIGRKDVISGKILGGLA